MKGSLELRRYYKRYREIVKDMGISLVDDLEACIWNMDEHRWSILVRELAQVE